MRCLHPVFFCQDAVMGGAVLWFCERLFGSIAMWAAWAQAGVPVLRRPDNSEAGAIWLVALRSG
jgi:hypothetical protein